MNNQKFLRTTFALVLFFFSSLVPLKAEEEFYVWVDVNGVQNLTTSPPPVNKFRSWVKFFPCPKLGSPTFDEGEQHKVLGNPSTSLQGKTIFFVPPETKPNSEIDTKIPFESPIFPETSTLQNHKNIEPSRVVSSPTQQPGKPSSQEQKTKQDKNTKKNGKLIPYKWAKFAKRGSETKVYHVYQCSAARKIIESTEVYEINEQEIELRKLRLCGHCGN